MFVYVYKNKKLKKKKRINGETNVSMYKYNKIKSIRFKIDSRFRNGKILEKKIKKSGKKQVANMLRSKTRCYFEGKIKVSGLLHCLNSEIVNWIDKL